MGSRWRGLRTDLGGEGVILLQYVAAASALQLLHNLGREGGREDMLVKVSPTHTLSAPLASPHAPYFYL
jgi:hypothetical protein